MLLQLTAEIEDIACGGTLVQSREIIVELLRAQVPAPIDQLTIEAFRPAKLQARNQRIWAVRRVIDVAVAIEQSRPCCSSCLGPAEPGSTARHSGERERVCRRGAGRFRGPLVCCQSVIDAPLTQLLIFGLPKNS